MSVSSPDLPKGAERAWLSYLDAEERGLRSDALAALDRFIVEVQQAEAAAMLAWSLDLVRNHESNTDSTGPPIRFPLLQHVVIPSLVAGMDASVPGCARLLSGLVDRFAGVDPPLAEGLRNPVALLHRALEDDPSDVLAARQLVDRRARYLVYTIHEVPSGVLYGMNGATKDQCDLLEGELASFRGLVDRFSFSGEYDDLVDECGFHYTAYRRYLDSTGYDSYRAYLDDLHPSW